jgi:hypothetical protein
MNNMLNLMQYTIFHTVRVADNTLYKQLILLSLLLQLSLQGCAAADH